jgi:hypothetical protein
MICQGTFVLHLKSKPQFNKYENVRKNRERCNKYVNLKEIYK